ncbi:cache domain-containing protein [Thalassospira sp. CH_XMU1448-2]|uniref:cache domain-containing protein n=1 Tax=Thalassospira sp. CH_XMU1448-2 TaxID=3107773 RepID=UPI00300B05DE
MKIRLQIGVTAAFTTIAVLMLGITVAFLYESNRTLALQTAHNQMETARKITVESLVNVITPVRKIVATTADLVNAFPDAISQPRGGEIMASQINGHSQIYGLFFGFQNDGRFFQVVQIPEGLKTFGPHDSVIPDKSKIVYRSVDYDYSGGMLDTFLYQSSWGKVTGQEQSAVTYDPRNRAWYKGAQGNDDVFISPFYTFNSTGKPGVTFAKRVLNPDGSLMGVVGADLTLEKVTEILSNIRIGAEGRVFLLGFQNRVIAYAGPQGIDGNSSFFTVGNQKASDPIVTNAILKWSQKPEAFFEFVDEKDGKKYLASAAIVPGLFGMAPVLGLIVPEDEFIGAIKATTKYVLKISGAIFIFTIILIAIISRMMSRQLNIVAAEAEKIGRFDLGGDFRMTSHIYEVSALSSAIANMKVSLKSFGAYVPTDLVKSIVSNGNPVEIGGEARDLSIMFTDIEGFTAKTENYSPTELARELSNYFAAMEHQITANGNGTIDKYIGDAIMAFWNAPSDDPDHVDHACRAALACRLAGRQLNSISQESKLFPLYTRFGLHTDRVVVGNVGSEHRLQYTALGGAVNLASRIEGLNKMYGTRILASDAIARRASDNFLLRYVDLVMPVGTSSPLAIYELIGDKSDTSNRLCNIAEQQSEIAAWDACMAPYLDHRWAEAHAAFSAHIADATTPKLVEIYIARCRAFMTNPPPKDWDGINHLSSK